MYVCMVLYNYVYCPHVHSVCLQCLRSSTSHCAPHYMALTLDLFTMESSFLTAQCQRGEPLYVCRHAFLIVFKLFHISTDVGPFSCSSCTSRFNCNWCPVEFQCRTSGADCSQSPVVSVQTALIQWYTLCTCNYT